MKLIIVYFLCFLFISSNLINAQTHYYIIPPQSFKRTTNYDPPQKFYYEQIIPDEYITTDEFKISQLISLKEYKAFLQSVKGTIHDTLYNKILPDSTCFKEDAYKAYFYGDDFDEYPAIAVTWSAINQFCEWKTLAENEEDSIRFIYRMPIRKEWLAAMHFFEGITAEHDFSNFFTDWIFNSFDENVSYFTHDMNPNYEYSNDVFDETLHPALKRKRILGKSYLFRNEDMNYSGRYEYMDKTAPYLAFRVVKVPVSVPSNKNDKLEESKIQKSPALLLLKKWDLLDKVVTEQNEDNSFSTNEKPFNGLTGAYHKISKSTDDTHDRIIKYTGEYKDGEKIGDWYYFDKKGIQTKHYYFNGEGKSMKMEVDLVPGEGITKSDKMSSTYYEFVHSLQQKVNTNSEIVNQKNMSFSTTKGRKNGYFVYSNGDFNIAGCYVDNMKTGNWCMWDCSERLVLQRNYINGFDYEEVFAILPQNKLTALLECYPFSLKYNNEGYYEYLPIEESDIIWSKRIWRALQEENNNLLFEDYNLIEILLKKIEKGEIYAYEMDEFYSFGDTVPMEDAIELFNPEQDEIVEYIVQEENVFLWDRFDMECRAFGICPVKMNKTTGEKMELFWIYLPETRKSFSQILLSGNELPEHIKTLDDVFFFRYYGGSIIIESNVYKNRKISDYLTGIELELEVQRIENNMLRYEFDMWGYIKYVFK